MADGRRDQFIQQEHADRTPDNLAVPDHHRVFAFECRPGGFDELHHGQRGAGADTGLREEPPGGVLRMDAFNVFARIDQRRDGLRINVLRQGLMHEDTVDIWIIIPSRNVTFYFPEGYIPGKPLQCKGSNTCGWWRFKLCHYLYSQLPGYAILRFKIDLRRGRVE